MENYSYSKIKLVIFGFLSNFALVALLLRRRGTSAPGVEAYTSSQLIQNGFISILVISLLSFVVPICIFFILRLVKSKAVSNILTLVISPIATFFWILFIGPNLGFITNKPGQIEIIWTELEPIAYLFSFILISIVLSIILILLSSPRSNVRKITYSVIGLLLILSAFYVYAFSTQTRKTADISICTELFERVAATSKLTSVSVTASRNLGDYYLTSEEKFNELKKFYQEKDCASNFDKVINEAKIYLKSVAVDGANFENDFQIEVDNFKRFLQS